MILFILCKRYAHVNLLLSTGDNPLVFTALKGDESEVIHQLLTSGVAKQTSFLPTTPTVPLTQHIIDSIAQNMEVRFEILQSFNSAVITLINKGSALIGGNLWAIYMCLATGLELGHLVHREDGYVLPDKKSIKLTHLSGCSFKIEPTKDFKAIPPGKSMEIMVHIGLTESRSDLVPRWYVAADGLEPRIIPNTASEALDFVFFPPKRRKSWDSFVNCDAADLGSAPLLVIPTPSEVVGFNATNKLSVDGNWIVFGEPGLEDETSFLAGNYNIWFSCKRHFRKLSGEDEVSSHGASLLHSRFYGRHATLLPTVGRSIA